MVDISLGKKALGHRLVAASAKIAALETLRHMWMAMTTSSRHSATA